MRYSNLFHSVLYYVFDAFIDFVLGKWSSIELHNSVIHSNPGFFADLPRHLSRVIVFNCYFSPGRTEYLLDVVSWEGVDESHLKEVCFYSIALKLFHSVEYSSL